MEASPTFSLIVPTRRRVPLLRRFLESLTTTTHRPEKIEIVLVIDEDDPPSLQFSFPSLSLRRVIVPPGQTMGALNRAGYEASAGRFLMLLNDDVVARTPGWDSRIETCLRSFPDEIVLVHTNDTLLQQHLCTFPLVSRTFCMLAGSICPAEYLRYRIDDHIEDIFNLLALLGERRTVFLPDVVFQHDNFVEPEQGHRIYLSDPGILARDAPTFETLFFQRKELALKLKEYIGGRQQPFVMAAHKRRLDAAADPFALRVPERLRIESDRVPRSSATARVSIGLVTADSGTDRFRHCCAAIRTHSRNYELIVADHQGAPNFHYPRELNSLLGTARTDFVVLLNDDVLVGPGWLDGLLESTGPEVALVTPLLRDSHGRFHHGVVFHPDGSGHHSSLRSVPAASQPVLTFIQPVLLLDRQKCRRLHFDEAYRRYFFDLDFGLQAWEAGWQVVCSPAATMTRLVEGPFPYGNVLDEKAFEEDRRIFEARWEKTNRMAFLEKEVWSQFPELKELLDLQREIELMASRGSEETMEDFRKRAGRAFPKLCEYPILEFALAHAGGGLSVSQFPGALPGISLRTWWNNTMRDRLVKQIKKWNKAARNRIDSFFQRLGVCFRQRGLRGLMQAVTRRLAHLERKMLASVTKSPPEPLPENPTREATHCPGVISKSGGNFGLP